MTSYGHKTAHLVFNTGATVDHTSWTCDRTPGTSSYRLRPTPGTPQ